MELQRQLSEAQSKCLMRRQLAGRQQTRPLRQIERIPVPVQHRGFLQRSQHALSAFRRQRDRPPADFLPRSGIDPGPPGRRHELRAQANAQQRQARVQTRLYKSQLVPQKRIARFVAHAHRSAQNHSQIRLQPGPVVIGAAAAVPVFNGRALFMQYRRKYAEVFKCQMPQRYTMHSAFLSRTFSV